MNTRSLFSLIVCALSMTGGLLQAEEPVPYEISKWGRVKVTKVTPEFFEEIQAQAERKPKILITKQAPQETLEALKQLEWVTELEIQSNLITDLSPLAAFSHLKEIKLNSMDMSKKSPLDISPLKAASQLEVFDSYATRITGTEALAGKETLREISFYMSAVESIDFLTSTPNVEKLDLYGTKHTFPDYQPVTSLKKLKELGVYMNEQAVDEKLAVLSELTTLEKISMSNCKKVTTLDFLANCENLRSIRALWCNELVDLSALKGKTEMVRLELDSVKADDFSFLPEMTKLESLNLEDTSFSDMTLLPKGAPMKILNLENTSITTLEGVQQYPTLSRLDIGKTKITDFSPVTGLKKLYTLEVPKEVSEEQKAALKEAIPNLRIR